MKQAFVMIRAGLLIPPVLLLLSLTAVPEWNLWIWLSLVLALGCVGGGLFAANTLQRQQAELEQRTRQLQASEQQPTSPATTRICSTPCCPCGAARPAWPNPRSNRA